MILKYDIITNQRGKLEARMYKEFEGYKADSATRTAQVATAITSGGSDPGFRRINSRLTRHLTKQANNEITRVCLKQTNTNAAEFANNALETFRALRYIRAPKSPSKRAFWADLAFPQMPKQNLSQKKKMTEEFTWGGEVYTYNPTQSWESVIFLDFALGLPLIIGGGLVWTPFILVVAAGFLTWLISFKFA